jgi:hypothetical protein
MNYSLPALSRFEFTAQSPERKALEDLIEKHGYKFLELELELCYALGILDACPSLNVFTFNLNSQVGPVSLVALASVYVFDRTMSYIATRRTYR